MSNLFKLNNKYLLRGSVSLVPLQDKKTIEFFKSNTRVSYKILLEENLINLLSSLNGELSLKELIDNLGLDTIKTLNFINYLEEKKLIETDLIHQKIKKHQFNHVLNFLADYIKIENLLNEFDKLQNSHVIIIGLGAVGSWVAMELGKSGIENFTLIDTDTVDISNLNRSYYTRKDIDTKKILVVKNTLQKINANISCKLIDRNLTSSSFIKEIIHDISTQNKIVINCADKPNVDTTSAWINTACLETNIPFIIAGGYNLHLTLLGPTILPYESACFECIQSQLMENDKIDDLLKSKKLVKVNRNIGNIAPMAIITSTFVVNETIRTLLRSKHIYPIMINRRGNFNYFNHQIKFFDFKRLDACMACCK